MNHDFRKNPQIRTSCVKTAEIMSKEAGRGEFQRGLPVHRILDNATVLYFRFYFSSIIVDSQLAMRLSPT